MVWVVPVAVPAPLPRLLDYRCDPAQVPGRGCRVVVPLGTRVVVGVVWGAPRERDDSGRLKDVRAVLDPQSLLDTGLLELLEFTAGYYHHPIGEVVATALPVRLRRHAPYAPRPEIAYALTAAGAGAATASLRSARQHAVLQALRDGALPLEQLRAKVPDAAVAIRTLLDKHWLERLEFVGQPAPRRAAQLPPLAPAQQQAVERILSARDHYQPLLLEGVTGSGKTEVYLAAVQAVVQSGRQALLLVPEIGLTPQFVARLRDRLSVRLGLSHSGLSEQERAHTWWLAAQEGLDVVVGTRSALFTPLKRLGLIVVDEEHDSSYKQGEGLRYSARDLALKRGQIARVPVVLGTATPSMETARNVEAGRYAHARLEQRHGAALPPALELVDLRQRPTFEGLSDLALAAIKETLARGEQTLVFKNQRGFAPVLICHDCGWHPDCADCNRPLTWHRREGRLRCHHCGLEQRQPAACPSCQSLALRGQGVGTERLEQFLGQRLPGVRLLRMDADSLSRKSALEEFLAVIGTGEAALVVGTQLLAKGHDWPHVTLVVIVDCDGALFSHDFRAGERLAQLVVQVAGRAGRGSRPGRVLLQTHQPEHPLLQAVLRGGYRAALTHERHERRLAGFPPFGALALLRSEAAQAAAATALLQRAAALTPAAPGVELSAPMPAPLSRRAGLFRMQLWLQAAERGALHADLAARMAALHGLSATGGARWSLDVDPDDLS